MKQLWQLVRKSMDTQNDHAHVRIKTLNKEWSEWEWVCTLATSYNALSRNGVSAQLMNIKYDSHVTKQNEKSSDITIQLDLFLKETFTDVGPSPKPNLFLHEQIPCIPPLEITKFDSCLFKNILKKRRCRDGLLERKMTTKFLLKSEFLEPKNSKDENFEEFKLFEKLKFGKSFENWNLGNYFLKSKRKKKKWHVALRWPCKPCIWSQGCNWHCTVKLVMASVVLSSGMKLSLTFNNLNLDLLATSVISKSLPSQPFQKFPSQFLHWASRSRDSQYNFLALKLGSKEITMFIDNNF